MLHFWTFRMRDGMTACGTSATWPARSHMSALEPFADMFGIAPDSRALPEADHPEGLLAATCCQRSGWIRSRVVTEKFLGKASIVMTSLLLPNLSYNHDWALCPA